jgi:hypothetical protein
VNPADDTGSNDGRNERGRSKRDSHGCQDQGVEPEGEYLHASGSDFT